MAKLGWFGSWVASNFGRAAAPDAQPQPEPPSEWSFYGRFLRIAVVGLLAIGVLGGAGWFYEAHEQHDWAVIVVAGDWRAHDGSPSEGFDNARHDVTAGLRSIGFNGDDIAQFSVRPERYRSDHVLESTRPVIGRTLADLASRTNQGCLLYFSSHGVPWGMILGDTIVTPEALSNVLDATCGTRPTIVIISACYSGAFVPALQANNRMIVTAARADRTSFGCGQDDRYPYFDRCILQELHNAHSFPELADRARSCVAQREAETGASPPSEPQISIGASVAANLPRW